MANAGAIVMARKRWPWPGPWPFTSEYHPPMPVHTDYLWFNTTSGRRSWHHRRGRVHRPDERRHGGHGAGLRDAHHGGRLRERLGERADQRHPGVAREAGAGRSDYRHHQTGEDNADAHLKRTILGHQVIAADHGRCARSRAVGAGLLCRVRRPAAQARLVKVMGER